MPKMLRSSLLIVWSSTLLDCAVKPPDVFACKSLDIVVNDRKEPMPSPTCKRMIGEASCGYCTYTISDKSFAVGNEPRNYYQGRSWDEMLDHAVILPARESYAPLKAYVINACKMTNCDESIQNWRWKLDQLDSREVVK